MKTIYILYLVYGEYKNDNGIELLLNICERIYPNAKKIPLIINNSICLPSIKSSNGSFMISGNNTAFEFSGWDAGFEFLQKNFEPKDDDFLLYANDTFHQRIYAEGGKKFLDYFDDAYINLDGIDLKKLAIGYLDDFPKRVELMGIKYQSWIRSNIFFLSYGVSKFLHPFTFPLSKEYLFGRAGESFFRPVIEISENWRAYISCWLFGDQDSRYPEYSLKWLKCSKLSENNRDFFKTKAITILSEHYLSARLHKDNIKILDTNFFPKRENRHISNYYVVNSEISNEKI